MQNFILMLQNGVIDKVALSLDDELLEFRVEKGKWFTARLVNADDLLKSTNFSVVTNGIADSILKQMNKTIDG